MNLSFTASVSCVMCDTYRLLLEEKMEKFRLGQTEDFLSDLRKKERLLQDIYDKARIAADRMAAFDSSVSRGSNGDTIHIESH